VIGKLFAEYRYEECLQKAAPFLEVAPVDATLCWIAAASHYYLGKYDACVRLVERAIDGLVGLAPDELPAQFGALQVNAMLEIGRYDDVQRLVGLWIGDRPIVHRDQAETVLAGGWAAFFVKRLAAAANASSRVLDWGSDPFTCGKAALLRGLIAQIEGDPKREPSLRQAVELFSRPVLPPGVPPAERVLLLAQAQILIDGDAKVLDTVLEECAQLPSGTRVPEFFQVAVVLYQRHLNQEIISVEVKDAIVTGVKRVWIASLPGSHTRLGKSRPTERFLSPLAGIVIGSAGKAPDRSASVHSAPAPAVPETPAAPPPAEKKEPVPMSPEEWKALWGPPKKRPAALEPAPAPPQPAPVAPAAEPAKPAAASPTRPAAAAAKSHGLLLITPNDGVEAGIRSCLVGTDYHLVERYHRVEQALDRTKLVRGSLILVDLLARVSRLLAADSSIAVSEILKNLPMGKVLMISTQQDKQQVMGALRKGAYGSIEVPFNRARTVAVLDRALEAKSAEMIPVPPLLLERLFACSYKESGKGLFGLQGGSKSFQARSLDLKGVNADLSAAPKPGSVVDLKVDLEGASPLDTRAQLAVIQDAHGKQVPGVRFLFLDLPELEAKRIKDYIVSAPAKK